MDIHLVSFAIPFPADYGGVIDVYYRMRALRRLGVRIHLHCFQYGGRQPAPELQEICASVRYYRRKSPFVFLSSSRPYIVSSRASTELLRNLIKENYPILFEGLHSCATALHPALSERLKIVRMHNVEWQYYGNLAKLSHGFRRLYFQEESRRLKIFEKEIAQTVNHVLPISQQDHAYYSGSSGPRVTLMPPGHAYEEVESNPGVGKHILFHGDLSVIENQKSAAWLMEQVFSKIEFPCVIAGKNPPEILVKIAANHANIQLFPNVSTDEMRTLVAEAQITVLHAGHVAGFKIKLLHSLYAGRYCVANEMMIRDTGLNDAVHQYADAPELLGLINALMHQPFTEELRRKREEILIPQFSNLENAKKLIALIQESDTFVA